ncbi:MAG: 5'/3'-nucleotidase SurE [Holosporales bacterium]|jgi:5'-nucleotidase|nr:5'/3'-nucleotidase SurE [Holosporales bacterium]
MRILLSNDDGIGAPGLVVLEDIVRKFAREVMVVAPESNMSGSGHSLTLKTPLRLTKHLDDFHFSVNGTPTDCIVMAIRHIMPEKPNFMISGINFDSNLAEDITYSGTVAAAMEATLFDVPSIAFSQKINKDGTINWEIAKTYIPIVLKLIMEQFTFPNHVFLNVNFPSGNIDEVKGILVTKQGTRAIDDHVIMAVDPRGTPYFWIGPADYRKNEDHKALDMDLGAVHNGYVSITPMSLDMTDMPSLNILRELFA